MRKLLAFVFCLLALAGTAGAQTPPGAALSPGYLSIQGNQFVDSGGSKMRIASTSYRGAPTDQASMNAIRQAGFNAIRIDWRDAYLSAGGGGTPTFDDEFATAPWLTHATWQSGDTWSFAGVNFPGGISQGPTWWSNPVDTPSAAPVYSDSGGHLNLGLIQNPGGNGISNTTLGALINNQETPGGLVQLFGDYQFSIAVPNTPGFLFQWDIECFPATCSDGNMEIDVGIWTNADGSEHVQLMSQANNLNNVVWYSGTPVDITQQNVYEVNWQSNFITFYINGTQMAQVATPGGEFQTAGALSYFLTSDATYFGYGPAFTAPSATAQLDYYRIYQTKPSGSAPVGCNTLAQMDQCVALAAAASPQPLKVIFSHRGNEIPSSPSNACNARQANGLWFDSGGSSGNDDGCGDGGSVTYAAFKANTASLMQRYAGNSTVIGYDFHAEPLINGAFTGTGGTGPSGGGFTANNGQIFDPNGAAWVARGFSVTTEDACGSTNNNPPCSLSNSQVPVATLQRLFPRVNYVRVANFLQGGASDPIQPSDLSAWVTSLTNLGIRVEFSDYQGNSQGVPCGTGAASWYQTNAAFYKNNPFVTWEGQNECFNGNGSVTDWQNMTTTYYNAVRAGNPNAQYVMGTAGGNMVSTYELSSSFLAPFSNVIIDGHAYSDDGSGYCPGCSQAQWNSTLAGFVSAFKSFSTNTETNIPFISGEFGNSSAGSGAQNADGMNAVNAVFADMSTGGATTTDNGAGLWLYFCGSFDQNGNHSNCNPTGVGDQLTSGGVNATIWNDSQNYGSVSQSLLAAAPGAGPTPAGGGGGGGTGANPPVNWGGGGDTDILAACNDVGAAVFAVNPGVIQFCEGPLNNGANNLLSGAAKP